MDGTNNFDSLGIPDTILLQTTRHHSTTWRYTGSDVHLSVSGVVPVLLTWVALIIDGDHSPHVDGDLNDDSVMLRVINGVAASFLQISAEVDARAEHPTCRLAKT